MAETLPGWAKAILHFWFEELGLDDWFSANPAIDEAIRARFEPLLRDLGSKPDAQFTGDPHTALAAILLFDQFPRNLYRHQPAAFVHDARARGIASEVIARGWVDRLPDAQRQFVGMPLMHSEALSDQQASLAFFEGHAPANLPFAQSHHEMIARFGRFPHRNAALGRDTTAEEQRAIDEGFSW
ncbi:MAG: DUF924 family protein [Erythrobacter sp.]